MKKWKETKLKTLTEAQKGYLAGMLDGEGHLYIRGEYEGSAYGVVRVRITADKAVAHLHEITGIGTVNSYVPKQRRKDGGEKRRVYEWIVQSRYDVHALLKELEPYLVIKKEQAKILLEAGNLALQGICNGIEYEVLRNRIAKLAYR